MYRVLLFIGVLTAYVGPRYFGQIGKSEINAAKAQVDALEKALEQYRLDMGHFPSSEAGLAALFQKPANEPKWQGPYLKKHLPYDPWGRPYQYLNPGVKGEIDVMSFGADGQSGGEGKNADVGSWQ